MIKTSFKILRVIAVAVCITCSVSNALAETDTTTVQSGSHTVVASELQLRHEIAGFARNYLGLKYHYAGRSPETGFDCSGFTHFVMDKFGINLSASSAQQSLQGEPVKLKEVQTGDLIFFRRSSRSRISHVAMVASNTEEGTLIIHSTTHRGVVIDNLMRSAYWRPKIYTARRVINPVAEETIAALEAIAPCGENISESNPTLDIAREITRRMEPFLCIEPLPCRPIQPLFR
jgi:hypothetical protein